MKKFKKPEFDMDSLKKAGILLGGATILYFGMKKIANALLDHQIEENNAALHQRAQLASELMRAHIAQTEHKPAHSVDIPDEDDFYDVNNSIRKQDDYFAVDQIHFYGAIDFRNQGYVEYDFVVPRKDAKNLPFFSGETDCLNEEELKYIFP